jgi:hypothetical protein
MKTPPLVRIEWNDACGATTAWQEGVHIAACVTVGFLISKDKREIILAHTQAEDGSFGGRFAIPRGFIKSFRYVKSR